MIKKPIIRKQYQTFTVPLVEEDDLNVNQLFIYIDSGNYAEVYKLFLSKRIYFNIKLKDESVLHRLMLVSDDKLTENKKLDFIKFLVANGAPINTYNKFNITPLHIAVERKYKKIVEYLLDSGANIHAISNDNLSVLHYATMINIIECPKISNKLLISNAKRGKKNINKITDNIIKFFYNNGKIKINDEMKGIKDLFQDNIKYIRVLNSFNYTNYKTQIKSIIESINRKLLQQNIDIEKLEIKKMIGDLLQEELNILQKKIGITENILETPDILESEMHVELLNVFSNIHIYIEKLNDIVHDCFKNIINLYLSDIMRNIKNIFDRINKILIKEPKEVQEVEQEQCIKVLCKSIEKDTEFFKQDIINFIYKDTSYYTISSEFADSLYILYKYSISNNFPIINIEIKNNYIMYNTFLVYLISLGLDISKEIYDENKNENENILNLCIRLLKLDEEKENVFYTSDEKLLKKYITLLDYKKYIKYDKDISIAIKKLPETINDKFKNDYIYILLNFYKLGYDNDKIVQWLSLYSDMKTNENMLTMVIFTLYKNIKYIFNDAPAITIKNYYIIEYKYLHYKQHSDTSLIDTHIQQLSVSNNFLDYFTLSLSSFDILESSYHDDVLFKEIKKMLKNYKSHENHIKTESFIVFHNFFDKMVYLDIAAFNSLDESIKEYCNTIKNLLMHNRRYYKSNVTEKDFEIMLKQIVNDKIKFSTILDNFNNDNKAIDINKINFIKKINKMDIEEIDIYYLVFYLVKLGNMSLFDMISFIICGYVNLIDLNISNRVNSTGNTYDKYIQKCIHFLIAEVTKLVQNKEYSRCVQTLTINNVLEDDIHLLTKYDMAKHLFNDIGTIFVPNDEDEKKNILYLIHKLLKDDNYKLKNIENINDKSLLHDILNLKLFLNDDGEFEKINFEKLGISNDTYKLNLVLLIIYIINIGININNILMEDKKLDNQETIELTSLIEIYIELIEILYRYMYFLKLPTLDIYNNICKQINNIRNNVDKTHIVANKKFQIIFNKFSAKLADEQKKRLNDVYDIVSFYTKHIDKKNIDSVFDDAFKNHHVFELITFLNQQNYNTNIIKNFNVNIDELASKYYLYDLEDYKENKRHNKIMITSCPDLPKYKINYMNIDKYNYNMSYLIRESKLEIDIKINKCEESILKNINEITINNTVIDYYLPLLRTLLTNTENNNYINLNNIKMLINLPSYIQEQFDIKNLQIENSNFKKNYEEMIKVINSIKEKITECIELLYKNNSLVIKQQIDSNDELDISIYDKIIEENNIYNIELGNLEENEIGENYLINNKRYYNINKLDETTPEYEKLDYIKKIINKELIQTVAKKFLKEIAVDFKETEFYQKNILILKNLMGDALIHEILDKHIMQVFEKMFIDSIKIIIYQDINKIFNDILNSKIDEGLINMKDIISIYIESYDIEYSYKTLNEKLIQMCHVKEIDKIETIFKIKLIESNNININNGIISNNEGTMQRYISKDYNNKIISNDCFKIDLELIIMLIKKGADLYIHDKMDKTPLDYILESKMYSLFDNEIIRKKILTENNKKIAFEKMLKIEKIENLNFIKIEKKNKTYTMIANNIDALQSKLTMLEDIKDNIPINIKYIFLAYTIIQNIHWYRLLYKKNDNIHDRVIFKYFFSFPDEKKYIWKTIFNLKNDLKIRNLNHDIYENERINQQHINDNQLYENKIEELNIASHIKIDLKNIIETVIALPIRDREYKSDIKFFQNIFKQFIEQDNSISYTYLWSFMEKKLEENYCIHLRLFDIYNDLLYKKHLTNNEFNNFEDLQCKINKIENYMSSICNFIDIDNNSLILNQNPLLFFQVQTCVHILSGFLGANFYVNLEKIFYDDFKNRYIGPSDEYYNTVKTVLSKIKKYLLSDDLDDSALSFSFVKINLSLLKTEHDSQETRTLDELFDKIIDLLVNSTRIENGISIAAGLLNESNIINNIRQILIPYYITLYQNILTSLLEYSDSYYRFIINSSYGLKIFKKILM
jgi:hypothetical protein